MPRHPNLEAAQKESKKRQKAATRRKLNEALNRLLDGVAERTDGRLIYANIYKEAGLSKSSLERNPDIKTRLDDAKNAKKIEGKPTINDIFDRNAELMSEVRALRSELSGLKKKKDKLEAACKQEIMILNRKIEVMQERWERFCESNNKELHIVK